MTSAISWGLFVLPGVHEMREFFKGWDRRPALVIAVISLVSFSLIVAVTLLTLVAIFVFLATP
jgi:hypothetical protein